MIVLVMKNRGRTEIMKVILETCQLEPKTKTKVMYTAFLSYAQIKEYLKSLVENGLLAENKNGMYLTTNKGQEFLKASRIILELVEPKNRKAF